MAKGYDFTTKVELDSRVIDFFWGFKHGVLSQPMPQGSSDDFKAGYQAAIQAAYEELAVWLDKQELPQLPRKQAFNLLLRAGK